MPGVPLPFDRAVRERRSIRTFRPDPLPDVLIDELLGEAQLSPSNCNTQPWHMHVVSGRTQEILARALLDATAGAEDLDFSFDMAGYTGRYGERRVEHGAGYHKTIGIARADATARAEASRRNFTFFGAPHVALLFMPKIGDGVRVAADIGMYAQTFLLALAARGLGGIPQTSLGLYASTVRSVLRVSNDLKLLFGISFGYPDRDAPGHAFRSGRDPLSACVTYHR